MSSVRDTVLFISEEEDYGPKPGVQDSDDEESRTQTLYTVDDIEEGLQQFERQRHVEVPEQPKFLGSNGSMEPISILEMVTKNEPVEDKLGAPPNGTDRLYTIEDILEALEMEDGHLSLKDEQEKKVNLSRTEESKKTVKLMRERCRRRMKEEERRIRKRTWRKYSLDSLNGNKISSELSGEKQELVDKNDDKETLSDRLSQLGGDKQEQVTGTEDKKVDLVTNAEKNDDGNAFLSRGIVDKTAASPVHDGIGDFSKFPISATQPLSDDKVSEAPSSQDAVIGDGFDKKSSTSTLFLPERKRVIPKDTNVTTTKSRFYCPLTEKTRRMVGRQRPRSTGCSIADVQGCSEYPWPECEINGVHGNGIKPPDRKLVGESQAESSDFRSPMDGPCKEERVSESDSQNRLSSEEVDRSAHEQNTGKANLNAPGKVRRLFSGFTRACRLLCCVSDASSSEE